MPTEKPRITFTLDEETLQAVEEYRFKYKKKNQSQAILSLIDLGMSSLLSEVEEKKNSPAPEGTEEREREIDSLESELRGLLVKFGLIDSPDGDLTADQLDFLFHVISLLKAYFKK